MIRRLLPLFAITVAACAPTEPTPPDFGLEKSDLKSGMTFLTTDTQSLQQDDFSNPGYLWVENGKEALKKDGCSDCHDEKGLSKSAQSFPKLKAGTNQLINLQGQINECRTERQNKDALDYESDDMLGLVTYIRNLSLGTPLTYEVSPEMRPHFEAGKAYFYKRRGQFNLSCAQCHDENWGAQMRGDTVSQGHINGFPAFRNDWQTLGSAHRRFQACNQGVRATQSELGALNYLQLETYLKARGSGLKNETPAIRR